jgi:hypothetical protein
MTLSALQFECENPAPTGSHHHDHDHLNARRHLRETAEGIDMQNSLGNAPRSFRGDPRPNISIGKRENSDWLADQAARRSEKDIADKTGLTPKAVGNLRQRKNKISFDCLVEWCRNDPDFAAAFAEHVGLIRPGEAEFAGALTRAFNAFQRRSAP